MYSNPSWKKKEKKKERSNKRKEKESEIFQQMFKNVINIKYVILFIKREWTEINCFIFSLQPLKQC